MQSLITTITLTIFVTTTIFLVHSSADDEGFSFTFNVNRHVYFELHKRNNRTNDYTEDEYELLKITNTNSSAESDNDDPIGFEATKLTRIIIHGYLSTRRSFLRYVRAFLKLDDCNVIVVNWLWGSVTMNYYKARNRAIHVGGSLARLIDFLVENHGLQLGRVLVVGHSLGAHVAGIAGHKLRSGRLPIIIGLDPAYPLFLKGNTAARLSVHDADYVQVIHTNGNKLGMQYPIGDADFYPNWGLIQPGCEGSVFPNHLCSHGRAHKLYIESLSPHSKFVSVPCASYEEISEQECTQSGDAVLMGGADPEQLRKAHGVYYTRTNEVSPFAMRRTTVEAKDSDDEIFYGKKYISWIMRKIAATFAL